MQAGQLDCRCLGIFFTVGLNTWKLLESLFRLFFFVFPRISAPTSKIIKVISRCSRFHYSLSSSDLNTKENEQIAADTVNHRSIKLLAF